VLYSIPIVILIFGESRAVFVLCMWPGTYLGKDRSLSLRILLSLLIFFLQFLHIGCLSTLQQAEARPEYHVWGGLSPGHGERGSGSLYNGGLGA